MRTRRSIRAAAAFLCVSMLIGTITIASADTKTQISAAQKRLSALEAKIASEQAGIATVHAALLEAASRVEDSKRQFDTVQLQLLQSRRARERVSAKYEAIRSEINSVAFHLYTEGPHGGFDELSPTSAADVTAALQYAGAIVNRDSQLADDANILAAQLKERMQKESAAMYQRAAVTSRLTDDQDALLARFNDEQNRLASLAAARAQVASLLVSLRKQLRAEEIAAAEAAMAGGISFGKWATAFLGRLNDPITRNNLVVIVAWETAEYTSARWNPLATTYPMRGSTFYNSSGVRNYLTLAQGLDATVKTLIRSGLGYEDILSNLAHSSDPMTTADAIRASQWCNGCANGQYVVDLIPTVEKYYDSYASAQA